MKRLALFLMLICATSAAELAYAPLFVRACSVCETEQNGQALTFEAVRLVQRNGLTKLTALRINRRETAIAAAEVVEADAPLPLYKLDLDRDGHDDLALNHRNGIRNRYFHYFRACCPKRRSVGLR